jgi:prepilin-type N-terminal cleavage/methylation domain-containing protein
MKRKLASSRAEARCERRGVRSQVAFTLIELLVVIAIIAILAAIAAPGAEQGEGPSTVHRVQESSSSDGAGVGM